MATAFSVPYFDGLKRGVRPYLSVRLWGPAGDLAVVGIVDSGADVTCLPTLTAALLGLRKPDLEPARVQRLSGAKAAFQAREPIRAKLEGLPDFDFELRPVFCQSDRALWGRADFFKVFDSVTFLEGEQKLVLEVP